MKASQFYESEYLTASDLNRGPIDLEIAAVCEATFTRQGGEEQTQLVLHFKNSAKGLVLNRSNAHKVIDGLGNETNDWIGHVVTLVPGKSTFNGRSFATVQIAGVRRNQAKK